MDTPFKRLRACVGTAYGSCVSHSFDSAYSSASALFTAGRLGEGDGFWRKAVAKKQCVYVYIHIYDMYVYIYIFACIYLYMYFFIHIYKSNTIWLVEVKSYLDLVSDYHIATFWRTSGSK